MFWLLAAKKKNQLLHPHLLLKHLLLLQLLPLKLLLPLPPTLLLLLPALPLLPAPLLKLPKTLHPPLQSNSSLRLEKPPQGGFFYGRSAGCWGVVLAFRTSPTNYQD
ncbi:hypothetical protein [Rhodoferax sp. WC2427]|uniref:hypothetical protein n=1 Tax=Rhodoferax sp. WC2427 TaxID=3234144 RepID=UPI003467AD0A